MKIKNWTKLAVTFMLAVLIALMTSSLALASGGGRGGMNAERTNVLSNGGGCGGSYVGHAEYQTETNDNGYGGSGAWATDNINSSADIYDIGGGQYCVVVIETGTFTTYGGISPDGGGTVEPGVTGTIDGSFIAIVTADSPNFGTLPPHDNECDDSGTCANYIHWRERLFNNPTAHEYLDWAWHYYKDCDINVSWSDTDESGHYGDITGIAITCGGPVDTSPILTYNAGKIQDIPANLYLGYDNPFLVSYLSGRGKSCDLWLRGGDLSAPVQLRMVPGSKGSGGDVFWAMYSLNDTDGSTLIDFHGESTLTAYAYCHGGGGGTVDDARLVTLHNLQ